jgi:hypothetical protein
MAGEAIEIQGTVSPGTTYPLVSITPREQAAPIRLDVGL